jgi:hypothetical protein
MPLDDLVARHAETFPGVHDKLYELFERPKKAQLRSLSIEPRQTGAVTAITAVSIP